MKITLEQIKEMERKQREYNRADKKLLHATSEDKKVCFVDETVYRSEIPKYGNVEANFYRLVEFIKYHIKKEYPNCVAIIGISSHKSWTPREMVTTEKGGKPHPVFSSNPQYRRLKHIHCYVAGDKSRSLTEKIFLHQQKYYPSLKSKRFNEFAFSGNCIPRNYVSWQCDSKREIGNIDDYLSKHQQG